MKKILIIGNADSVFVKQYCENLIKTHRYKIYLLTRNNSIYTKYYTNVGINVIHYVRSYEGGKERLYKFLVRTVHQVKQYSKEFDIIHVHYVDRVVLTLAKVFGKNGAKVIVSYWGSDIFRKKDIAFQKEEKVLERADVITFVTKEMEKVFEKKYCGKFQDKLKIIDFGLSAIDEMDKLSVSEREKIRKEIGINKNEVAIAIGYNGIKEQQHLQVIRAIKQLNSDLRENIYLYLHMSYGVSDKEYIRQIERELIDLGCRYNISYKYMDSYDIARLRSAIDIFINAQTTDALSASMLEYLYSGCIVMNPKWLTYEFLEENKIEYTEYKDFYDLKIKLEKILLEKKYNIHDIKHTREIISKFYSWSNVIKKWEDIY